MYTVRLIWNKVPHWIAWLLIFLDVCVWELPQNLCGLIVKLIYCRYGSKTVESIQDGPITTQLWGMTSGVSLGWFGFVHKSQAYNKSYIVCHENIGHAKQSLYSGIFYLLIFGLPSVAFCVIYSYTNWIDHNKYSYYDFYTERLADKLAGIPYRGIKYKNK